MQGVSWGLSHAPFTPAYWAAQWWYARAERNYANYRRGATLREEIAACLLGGHGITAELNNAAFYRLRTLGLLNNCASVGIYEKALAEPLTVSNRQLRYRFPKQKARFLHAAMQRLEQDEVPADHLAFRSWLLKFTGIGSKTASWITRNWLDSNQVAIIDIHVFRAATIAGIFQGSEIISRDYARLEKVFLYFAQAIGVEASQLDVLMWRHMKDAGRYAIECYQRHLAREGFLLT